MNALRAEPTTEPKSLVTPAAGRATPGAPDASIWVTVLVENSVHGRQLQGEHGLAFCLHTARGRLLFDTGQSDLLVRNAAVLGMRLDSVQAIALSHGHYDHTGGLPALRTAAPTARLFLHPDALIPRFSGQPDGSTRAVGLPEAARAMLLASEGRIVWTRAATEVIDGVFLTGEIPRETAFEDTGGRFYLDAAGTQADPLLDDQALFFDTAEGVVVLLGCAHAGVVNTLRHIRRLTARRPVQAVLGGFHLLTASEARLQATLAALAELDLRMIGAGHCTGPAATARLWAAFPDRCCTCAVGSAFRFQRGFP
jgi:7,8-dihydropterin-6-yl-methyl-4-(beta-D-ribofuranosyl)aminobenzene 5'-phosphate synthase